VTTLHCEVIVTCPDTVFPHSENLFFYVGDNELTAGQRQKAGHVSPLVGQGQKERLQKPHRPHPGEDRHQ
jgi:hypothetical protein